MRAVRDGARAREPRRAPAAAAATGRRSPCSRTPTSCPPTRASGARPVRRRARRRRGLGTRRARHERPGRRERRRARDASRARAGAGTGDLIFIAAADEEVGDGFGLDWLVSEHPEAVRADYSVNEGGGDRVELGGRVLYLCADRREDELAVRAARARPQRPCRRCRGSPTTRSSRPRRSSSGSRAFAAEPRADPRDRGVPGRLLGERAARGRRRSALARAISPLAGELIEPLLGTTVAPTMARASREAERDPVALRDHGRRRLLPGQTPEECSSERPRAPRRRATTS